MNDPSTYLLETIFRQISEAAPNPWYPSRYAQATGISLESLNPQLDQLRLAGLVRLTDWVPGDGQGYVLTSEGGQVMKNPRQLARLQQGELPAPRLVTLQPNDLRASRASTWERGEVARNALLNRATPRVTFALIILNVLWFAAGVSRAVQEKVDVGDYLLKIDGRVLGILHQIGAVDRQDISVNREWWRLLTCCFVHIGLLHLFVNMYSLFAVGPLLEQVWGSWRFLVLYLIAGLGGSCAMVIFSPVDNQLGAGASGAIWGLLGSLVAWVYLNRKVLPPALVSSMRRQLMIVFVLNIFITFTIPGISASAHFGGGAVGLIASIPMDFLRFGRGWQRALALAALLGIPVVCLGLVARSFASADQRQDSLVEIYGEFNELRDNYKQLVDRQVRQVLQDPQNLDPVLARQTLAALDEKQAQLNDLSRRLEKVGPSRTGVPEKQRQQFEEKIQELSRNMDRVRKILQKAGPRPEN